MLDFFWKCEEWMKEVMKQAEECGKQLTPVDRRSTTSKSSGKHIRKPVSQC